MELGSRCVYTASCVLQDLYSFTDCPRVDLDGVNKAFLRWWETKKGSGLLTYRDVPYHSLVTKKLSPAGRMPWLEDKDATTYLESITEKTSATGDGNGGHA